MRLAFAGEVFAADAVGQIFDVFSQIQYNGGMPRKVQACLKLNRRTGLIPVIFLRF